MSAPRGHAWFELTWPREVSTEHALAALLALAGLATPRRGDSIVLRAVGTSSGVQHFMGAPTARAAGACRQLGAAIPGLSFRQLSEQPPIAVDRAWRLWLSSRQRPLDVRQPEAISRAILTALASVEAGELMALQWHLGPTRAPRVVGSSVRRDVGATSVGQLLLAPGVAPGGLDSEDRRLLRSKQALPGWKALLRIGVSAKGVRRQHQLLGRLTAAIRMAQAPGVQLGFRPSSASKLADTALPWRWPVRLNAAEARSVVGWPIGDTGDLPVNRSGSRPLAVPRDIPQRGRVVAVAGQLGDERPLAISARDSLHHVHLVGPTGTGKSTVLLNLIVQDLDAGRAVVVIEPKGDLIGDVLARVPDHRIDDIVLIDPADAAPVGINPLVGPGSPELKADHLLAVFKGLFGDAIGPRTQDLLTAGLLTLTAIPHATLVALPLLFTRPGFRRRLLPRVRDPLALDPFWAWFEALSPAEQSAVLAPLMNKLRIFLLRPQVRRVIGQTRPRFSLHQVFSERRVLLVNLAKGSLGPEAAGLLGSAVMSQLWQATLARQQVSPAERHPTMVFVDEFQDYLHLPTNLVDVLAQARSHGVAIHVAHQHLAQLRPEVRAAVLGNARSRIIFQTGADDARALIGGDRRLSPADVEGLGRFQVYASLVAGGEATRLASARTAPPPPAGQDADAVRARSRSQWGVPAVDVERELELLAGDDSDPPPSFGVVRRPRGDRP